MDKPGGWRLSVERAVAGARYLISNGVESRLVSARGFGSHRPIRSNRTKEGRAQNRRIDIVVVQGRSGPGKVNALSLKFLRRRQFRVTTLDFSLLFPTGSTTVGGAIAEDLVRFITRVSRSKTIVHVRGYPDRNGGDPGAAWRVSAARAEAAARPLLSAGVEARLLSIVAHAEPHPGVAPVGVDIAMLAMIEDPLR